MRLLVIIALIAPLEAYSVDKLINVDLNSKIKFKVGHLFGKSEGSVKEVELSEVVLFREKIKKIKIVFLGKNIYLNNKPNNCKIREVVELDYELSGYPGDSVCDEYSNIPDSGNKSSIFPKLEISLSVENPEDLETENGTKARGTLSAHGSSMPIEFELRTRSNGDKVSVNLKSEFDRSKLNLKIRKPFFFSISDIVHLNIDFDVPNKGSTDDLDNREREG